MLDLGIQTINIYEFEGADYLKKRKKDKDMLMQAREDYLEQNKLEKR